MNDSQLVADVEAYVECVWPDVIEDIRALVAIPSMAESAKAQPGAPFGPEARRALDQALSMAQRLGLEPTNMDGYLGYADLPGKSGTLVATICHVDVVPAGVGWTQDPFTLTERDGYLLGRGVVDDKGPAVLNAYMARYFVEKGEQLPYTLRVMFGSDEECGMTDVEHYLAVHGSPAFLFTPDAEFPACVGEKGHLGGFFTSPVLEGANIVAFEGGTVTNAVPGLASAVVRADAAALPAAEGIDVEPAGEGLVRLTAHGKGGHASMPAGTKNAIGMLVAYLEEAGLVGEPERPFLDLLGLVFASTDGSSLGIAATDDLFDPLTCIGGTIKLEGGRLVQTVDCRYPKSITGERITQVLSELAAAHGAQFTCKSDAVPFYIDPENPAVTALIDAYNQFTGKSAKPFTMGGGTYARHFANAVSFGPEEPGEPVPDWVGPMHGPDEGVSVELLKRSLKIYIYALTKLMELEF